MNPTFSSGRGPPRETVQAGSSSPRQSGRSDPQTAPLHAVAHRSEKLFYVFSSSHFTCCFLSVLFFVLVILQVSTSWRKAALLWGWWLTFSHRSASRSNFPLAARGLSLSLNWLTPTGRTLSTGTARINSSGQSVEQRPLAVKTFDMDCTQPDWFLVVFDLSHKLCFDYLWNADLNWILRLLFWLRCFLLVSENDKWHLSLRPSRYERVLLYMWVSVTKSFDSCFHSGLLLICDHCRGCLSSKFCANM